MLARNEHSKTQYDPFMHNSQALLWKDATCERTKITPLYSKSDKNLPLIAIRITTFGPFIIY